MIKLLQILLGETPEKHIKLGDEYYKKGKYEEALKEYKKALDLESRNQEAREKVRLIFREKETLKTIRSIEEEIMSKEPIKIEQEIEEESGEKIEEGGDRREFIRIYEDRNVIYKQLQKVGAKEEHSEGLSENISAGGIYLIVEEKLLVGSFLELKFDFPPHDNPIFAIGKIVRREEIKDGDNIKYGLGIKFTNISQKDRERIEAYAKKYKNQETKYGNKV